MRLFLILSLLIASQFAVGQNEGAVIQSKLSLSSTSTTQDTPQVIYVTPKNTRDGVAYLLDGKLIQDHFLTTIDPDQIEEINVEKKPMEIEGNNYDASISIRMKEGTSYRFLSLKELTEEFLKPMEGQTVFTLDGKAIQEIPDQYFVNAEYILRIEVTQVPQAKTSTKLNVIALYTKSEENIEAFSQIRLRGLN